MRGSRFLLFAWTLTLYQPNYLLGQWRVDDTNLKQTSPTRLNQSTKPPAHQPVYIPSLKPFAPNEVIGRGQNPISNSPNFDPRIEIPAIPLARATFGTIQPVIASNHPVPPSSFHRVSATLGSPINLGLQATLDEELPAPLKKPDDLEKSNITGDYNVPPQTPVLWWQESIRAPLFSPQNASTISLSSLIPAALQNSRQIQIVRFQSQFELERVTQADAKFDWNLFTQKLWKDTNEPTGSDLDAGPGTRRRLEEDASIDAGLKRTNRVGGQFEGSQKLQLNHTNSQFFNPNDRGISLLTLRYNQPLLRDGGRLVNEGQVVVAQLLAESANADYQTRINDVLQQVVKAYWQLYRSRVELCIQRELLTNTQELLEELGRRRRIDAQPALIAQVESQVAAQKSEIAAVLVKIQRAQHELIRQVGDRGIAFFEELIPLETPLMDSMDPNASTSLAIAIQNRGEIRSAMKRIQSSGISRDIARHQLLPQLAMIMESNVTGINGGFQVFRSVGDQFSEGAPTYSVGFNLDYPIGNRAARSRLRQSELAAAKEAATFEDEVDKVRQEVYDAVAALKGFASQATNRETAAIQSKTEVHALLERRRIFPEEFDQVSQLYIRTYLDALQRLATAEQALVTAHVEYSLSLVQLRRNMGILHSVAVDETSP